MSIRTFDIPVFSRFVVVGLTAAVIYATLALLLSALFSDIAEPAFISLLAYVIAAVFSYSAHRYFTFASKGTYRFEVPRFILMTLFGVMISIIVPIIIGNWLGLPMYVAVMVVCIVVPLINFFALDRWVFAKRNPGA